MSVVTVNDVLKGELQQMKILNTKGKDTHYTVVLNSHQHTQLMHFAFYVTGE